MTKRIIDLTAEELERVATAAWTAAAKEALAKGLSVTGSHEGRLFRYFPDRRIENLGPVRTGEGPPSHEGSHEAGATISDRTPPTPSSPLPGSVIADIEATFRNIAETSLSQGKAKAAAEEASAILEGTYATASRGAADYNQKVVEMARENANATFDFAAELLSARTFSEFVELTIAHARRQFEALAEQSKELAILAQKVAMEAGSVEGVGGTADARASEHRPANQRVGTKS